MLRRSRALMALWQLPYKRSLKVPNTSPDRLLSFSSLCIKLHGRGRVCDVVIDASSYSSQFDNTGIAINASLTMGLLFRPSSNKDSNYKKYDEEGCSNLPTSTHNGSSTSSTTNVATPSPSGSISSLITGLFPAGSRDGKISRSHENRTRSIRRVTPLLPIHYSNDSCNGDAHHKRLGRGHNEDYMPSSQQRRMGNKERFSSSASANGVSPLYSRSMTGGAGRGMSSSGAAGANAMCSSFVFGGTYYPGKDKKRRRLRGSICYRIFCSPMLRLGVTCVIAIYVLIRYFYSSSSTRTGHKWAHVLSVSRRRGEVNKWIALERMIPSVQQMKELEIRIRQYSDTLPDAMHYNNINILRGIVPPGWPGSMDRTQNDIGVDNTENIHPDESIKNSRGMRTRQNIDTSLPCPVLPQDVIPTVSLIIQSSVERLWLLAETCKRWTDPIILVVYYSEEKDGVDPWKDIMDWENVCPQVKLIPYIRLIDELDWEYPINRLRNVGLDNVDTTHVLVLDVDFIPSKSLLAAIRQHSKVLSDARSALVVPAFERKVKEGCGTTEECRKLMANDSRFLPETFDDLQQCIRKSDCIVFQSDNNWEGHFTTKSELWLEKRWYDEDVDESDAPIRRPKMIDCFHSFRYEPYVVIRWCKGATPYYDERFHGYGKNKIQHVSHLRYLNYGFAILPEGFIIHHPHPESRAKNSWNDQEGFDLHLKMDTLYPTFLKELHEKYGRPNLGQCSRSLAEQHGHRNA